MRTLVAATLLAAACAEPPAAPPVDDDVEVAAPDTHAWLPWQPKKRPGESTSPPPRAPDDVAIDDDADGLDDEYEMHLATAYLPFLALHPEDECPLNGLVVRVRPHPANPRFVHVLYDQLFSVDCGLNGHVGDDEVFGVTIDPAQPPPAGIQAIVAISHQNAFPCERTSTCGSCAGLDACETGERLGAQFPIVFSSKNKHGGYVSLGPCQVGSCLDVCEEPSSSVDPPIVNAGEPGHPLVQDLTDEGFVTTDNGWDEALLHVDPWDEGPDFGGAGNIALDLVDDAFLPPVCE